MGLVQSCLGKKNKIGIMSVEEAKAYKKKYRFRDVEEENGAEEALQRVVLQTTNATAQTRAVADVERTTYDVNFRSSVPKLPHIYRTNYKLVQVLGPEKLKEEQKKQLIVENQEHALIRHIAVQEQILKAARKPRPKAAKFKRTVHVAFSDTS